MRSLPKLIPGVHPKLPGDAQAHVKRAYAHAEEHRIDLNLYIVGEGEEEPEPDEMTPEAFAAEAEAAAERRLQSEANTPPEEGSA
jgi:ssDNA-binding replication factor A large subunit